MIDLSKYKITHIVSWSDNLGRWIVTYNSDLLGVQTVYLLPDGFGNVGELDEGAGEILGLNFWFVCLQVDQTRKNLPAEQETTQNAGLGAVDA